MLRVIRLIVVSLFLLASLGSAMAQPEIQNADAEAFAAAATGQWSSAEQSASPDYDWVESRMVRIWPEREDGVWLYQQNRIVGASPNDPDADLSAAPYFQVIIRFVDLGDGLVHTTTHRVTDRAAALAAVEGDAAFDEALLAEVACMGRMQRIGEGFWEGSTTCPSGYRGGVKVESRSVRAPGYYVNWDRGFDADGRHIWGPSSGGYIFIREETEP